MSLVYLEGHAVNTAVQTWRFAPLSLRPATLEASEAQLLQASVLAAGR